MTIRRSWRVFCTGLAFATFGAGALFITLVVVPLLRLSSSSTDELHLRVQRVVHHAFQLFVWFMQILGLIRVSRIGIERLKNGSSLVIANHPTLIDVVLLVASMPQADCIVKKAASMNPLLRRLVLDAGYLVNEDGNLLVESAVSRLSDKRSLLLFPEGTRSPRGGLGPFQRGAAHIALQSGRELLPVVITCDPPTLLKCQRWYDVPERAAHLTLRVESPIPPAADLGTGMPRALAARRLTADVWQFYRRRLSHAQL